MDGFLREKGGAWSLALVATWRAASRLIHIASRLIRAASQLIHTALCMILLIDTTCTHRVQNNVI